MFRVFKGPKAWTEKELNIKAIIDSIGTEIANGNFTKYSFSNNLIYKTKYGSYTTNSYYYFLKNAYWLCTPNNEFIELDKKLTKYLKDKMNAAIYQNNKFKTEKAIKDLLEKIEKDSRCS